MVASSKGSDSSSDESDPTMVAVKAQQRIFELKKERDERMSAIARETKAELAKVRSQVVTYYEEKRRYRAKIRAQFVMKLAESTERRGEIEAEMMQLVKKMHLAMQEVEGMMLAGYDGRDLDAQSSRNI